MKKKSSFSKNVLSNKWILYIVFIASVLNIIWYMCRNDIIRIFIFIISALITNCFTRNMILILGIPLLLSIVSRYVIIEGFTEEKPESNPTDNPIKVTSKPTIPTNSDIVVPADETEVINTTESSPQETTPIKDDSSAETTSKRINYADTLVTNIKSYRDLLGTDGFSKMTQDTKELLRQQDELGKSIKQFAPIIDKMTPFLSQASGFLNKLDTSHLKEITKNIKNI